MINVTQIAREKRSYNHNRLSELDDTQFGPGAVVRAYQPFSRQLLDAARNHAGATLPAEYALAHPAVFMRALSSLSGGKKKNGELPSDPALSYLAQSGKISGAEFVNVVPDNLRRVGIFHTVAVTDWLGLLGDIGRGARFAHALGLPLQVMLAATSWVCANRSVFQITDHELFPGGAALNKEAIEDLLDLNTTRRRRLYTALGILPTVEEIPAYDRQGNTINRGTLQEIAQYYTRLAQTVYGVTGELNREQQKMVAAARPHGDDERLPEATRVLHHAGLLEGDRGKADLLILRTVAAHFSRFDLEVFIYYFAQLFGQQRYSGDTLKTAVLTEQRFDGALHDHRLHIHERWGNGGTPPSDQPLAASYDLQYALGAREVLPYTPISLGVVQALKEGGHLPSLLRGVCALSVDMPVEELIDILKSTDVYALNRLMADLTSFLLLCHRQSPEALKDACVQASLSSGMNGVFQNLGVERSWQMDSRSTPGEETVDLWMSWLNAVELMDQLQYVPLHLWFVCQNEWSEGSYHSLAHIAMVAKNVYNLVTRRNWVSGV